MNLLPNRSAHLVVTSPPYWQLKDYGAKNQIGFHDTYQAYINHLNLVWKECHRVLHPGCRLCINIGDQFARSVYYGRYKVIPIRTEIIKFCETIGFDYMGAIIWQKVTTTNTTGGATVMGSYPNPRNGILKLDYEFILIFKKHGKAPPPDPAVKTRSAMTKEEWNTFFSGHWNFPGVKQKGHIAMFPEELPRRLIKMFSFASETVLDPFLGSGTTSLAAMNLQRNSAGYEINPSFFKKIKEKLKVKPGRKKKDAPTVEFLKDRLVGNPEKEISQLPYIFNDPLRFDKKTNPHIETFGSRIGVARQKKTEIYFSVKKIISPTLIELNDGKKIRLLGIKQKKITRKKAMDFLKSKTKGQKVYLRFDEKIKNKKNEQPAYLYLKNKTFLNAHLIKNELVEVDIQTKHKYLNKFIKMKSRLRHQHNKDNRPVAINN